MKICVPWILELIFYLYDIRYVQYTHHIGVGQVFTLSVCYLAWCIGEVSFMASSIGGAVRGCPAVLVRVFGSCQLVL